MNFHALDCLAFAQYDDLRKCLVVPDFFEGEAQIQHHPKAMPQAAYVSYPPEIPSDMVLSNEERAVVRRRNRAMIGRDACLRAARDPQLWGLVSKFLIRDGRYPPPPGRPTKIIPMPVRFSGQLTTTGIGKSSPSIAVQS